MAALLMSIFAFTVFVLVAFSVMFEDQKVIGYTCRENTLNDYIITVVRKTFFATRKLQFVGHGAAWRELASGNRCDKDTEYQLFSTWENLEFLRKKRVSQRIDEESEINEMVEQQGT